MMQVLESVDKLMNALPEQYYSRLLGNLSFVVYAEKYDDMNTVLTRLDALDFPDEEKAIIQYFIDNPNIRPGVLASCYSRMIQVNFKVHYSIR